MQPIANVKQRLSHNHSPISVMRLHMRLVNTTEVLRVSVYLDR